MAEPKILQIPRSSDEDILRCFQHLVDNFNFRFTHADTVGGNTIVNYHLNEDDSPFRKIIESNSSILDTIRITNENYHINYYRGGRTQGQNGAVFKKSPYYDEITFSTDHANLGEVHTQIAIYVSTKLKSFNSERALPGISKEQVALEALHESTLSRLESTNAKLLEETHQYRLYMDKELIDKRSALIKEFEISKSNNDKLLSDELIKLQIEREELEKRKQILEDKTNTHARREIRRDIIKEIKNRQNKFSLTNGTIRLRWLVLGLIGLLAVVSGTFATLTGFSFWDAVKGASPLTVLISLAIKQTMYSAVAIGSIMWAIKWQDRWFEQHSQAEFHLKKFELDMERASWLVETSLEWKDAKGVAIPTELLQCLSNDLFSNSSPKIDKAKHPLDQLASALLGSARGIKLKVGDNELDLDPKKLDKIRSPEES